MGQKEEILSPVLSQKKGGEKRYRKKIGKCSMTGFNDHTEKENSKGLSKNLLLLGHRKGKRSSKG